ncbi:MAG: M48 family metalloprotease [Gammaproteobacteria bacterium]|jgi:predicted Zn-dependent protease|nr:M48 family metalloprotease [Gammaproteobacteria bacterium]MBQ0773594.1 M48 family metalloprotease [Gammaproteobacteria bacterium]|tara:strand:+ start:133321 stop:134166 length:846 start_codon:yes stop_codon:yes gene_type:complete
MNIKILSIVALGLLTSACNTIDLSQLGSIGSTLNQAFVPANEDDEKEIGDEAAAVLLGAAPVLNAPALQQYVNKVGLWVALQSDRPDLPWRFAVLDDPDINAFAAPGGYVFITKGMLARLQSEAELAGVLGHEVAHVVQKHHLIAIRKQARTSLLGMAASAALTENGHDAGQVAAVVSGAKDIYGKGLDRKDEYQADRLGVVLAARAGYEPYALPAVLQTLDRINPDASELGLLFKTHPKPADRLARLDAAMYGSLDQLDGVSGESRFRQQMAKLAASKSR